MFHAVSFAIRVGQHMFTDPQAHTHTHTHMHAYSNYTDTQTFLPHKHAHMHTQTHARPCVHIPFITTTVLAHTHS